MVKRAVVVAALILGMVLAVVAEPAPVFTQEPEGTVIAEGLNGPQGIYIAEDGTIWVADSGTGGDEEFETIDPNSGEMVAATRGDTARVIRIDSDGTQTVVATLPSVLIGMEATGAARITELDGEIFVTSGAWIGDGTAEVTPPENVAAVVRIGEDGEVETVASLWRIERRMNPDGTVIESHPYGIAAGPDGNLWVADAGGNTLLRVGPDSNIVELVATFQPIPGAFPSRTRGGEMLADPVPTGIDFDDDGNALVSFLSGAPFVPGSAKVVRVTPRGEVSDYATGLTMLTDLRRGPDGNFYGVQFAVFTDEGPTPNSGAIVRIAEGEGSTPVIEGLSFPTSVAFNEAGDAFVTVNGMGAPGSGAVVMFEGVASGEAAGTIPPAEEDGGTIPPTEEATEEPTEEPAEEETPAPTEEPAEEAAAAGGVEATSMPAARGEATPAVEEEATAEPTEEPTEEPAEEAAPEPTEEPAEEPTEEATEEPVEEATVEPTAEPTAGPTEEPIEEEPTPVAEEEATPAVAAAGETHIEAVDQPSDGTRVMVARVVAAQPGWIVIYADEEGRPGEVLGHTAVASGETSNIVVILDAEIAGETPLWAVLHTDAGERGTFEYPGPDEPVQADGTSVMASFVVEAPGGEAAAADLVDTAASDEQFSTLVAALQAAGLVEVLKSEGPFTIFAPTNDAFAALPEGTLDALLTDPAGDLSRVLLDHVMTGTLLADNIRDGRSVNTLGGGTLTFSVDDDQVMVNGATVTATDITASNGVIHVIDAVLLAEGEPEATPEPTEEPVAEATAEPEEEATPEPVEEPTEEPAEEPTAEATPTPAAEEEATPEPVEEPIEAPTEEPVGEPTAEPTEEPGEEAATATPAAEEEAPDEGAPEPGSKGAPDGMPDTGGGPLGVASVLLVVGGVLAALAGSVVLRRKA